MRIVIVGGGTAGWMAAAALRHRLSAENYRITLVESDDIGTVGVGEATLPHIKVFNDMLGIDEAAFMRETRATFKIGIEFRGWDRPDDRYIHPFGAFGEPWGGIEFQHYWLRARQAGSRHLLDEYSYAVAAARSNAFEFPNEDPKSIRSTFAYAYHFDAGRYADFLRSRAIERGVHRIEGRVQDIGRHAESGDITRLTLRSGARIDGDLFIDCTGFRSLLLGGIFAVDWEDWTHWLPCDRAFAVPCERAGPLTPYTRATAQAAGWTWRIPLQHRVGNGYVFSSRYADDDSACATLLGALEGKPGGEPRLLRFSPGRRKRAWAGNCVGIGLASGFLEPLESTSIFLIQAAVIDLIDLLPAPGAKGIDRRLAAEFNRLSEMQYERIRDFLVLHYVANSRGGEPLWDYVRSMPVPESLTHKLELFRARAVLPNYELGLFARDSWLSVLVGQGIVPEHYDRLADVADFAALEEKLDRFRTRIRSNVAAMPAHDDFIAGYCSASAQAGARVAAQ